MGGLCSCLGSSEEENTRIIINQPTQEEKRQQVLEAAERRQREQEARGLHNPERVKQKQKKMEELEKKHNASGPSSEGGLRWQVN